MKPTMVEPVARLGAAQAANPPSLLRRMMDDPALHRRMRDESRQRAQQRFPHLFEPDYSALWLRMGGGDVPVLDSGDDVEPVQRTRKRKPTLAGVARQATKAGLSVCGYELRPDGTIGIVIGKPVGSFDMDDATSSQDRSEWN